MPNDVGRGKKKVGGNNIMLNQGMVYFVAYESFTCPELLTTISLRHITQGYMIRVYKEQKNGKDESKYQLNIFLDYFPTTILNAFAILDD